MKAFQASVSVFFDKRREKHDGTFPLKLRVYHNYETRFYPTGIDLSPKDFQRSYLAEKPRKDFKTLNDKIRRLEDKAKKIIEEIPVFSFEAFEKKMFRHSKDKDNVFSHYDAIINTLNADGSVSTAGCYSCAKNSLKAFLKATGQNSEYLRFDAVTQDFLNRYEKWMTDEGCSVTSVGIYTRTLRTVFNRAIADGDITPDIYPFRRKHSETKKYQIPAGANIKKALSREDLKKLFNAEAANEYQRKARDFWFFSYACNGINMADICGMKYKNIGSEAIFFIREKTRSRTNGNPITIIAPLTDFIKQIIEKYGNKPQTPDSYVFPIYSEGLTPQQKFHIKKNFTRLVNQHMKKLCKVAGLQIVSTYSARHSFANVSLNNGATPGFIQDALGHTDSRTTQNYLKGFEIDIKRKNAEMLMSF